MEGDLAMSGYRTRWPRHMRRRYGCPPDGAWYCCGGRLMRSMLDPADPAVSIHYCPKCGIAIRTRGPTLLEVLSTPDPPAQPRHRQLTLFD